MRMNAQVYEVREPTPPKTGLLRKCAGPVFLFVCFFYLSLIVQQTGRFVTAHAMGATDVGLRIGTGKLRTTAEIAGKDIGFAREWWWGPQVVPKGKEVVIRSVAIAGPALGVLLLGLLLWDARRGHNALITIGIMANVTAICVTVFITFLAT